MTVPVCVPYLQAEIPNSKFICLARRHVIPELSICKIKQYIQPSRWLSCQRLLFFCNLMRSASLCFVKNNEISAKKYWYKFNFKVLSFVSRCSHSGGHSESLRIDVNHTSWDTRETNDNTLLLLSLHLTIFFTYNMHKNEFIVNCANGFQRCIFYLMKCLLNSENFQFSSYKKFIPETQSKPDMF